MKIKELIKQLENLNPEKKLVMRAYVDIGNKIPFHDLPIHDLRLTKEGKIVVSNQCGVE